MNNKFSLVIVLIIVLTFVVSCNSDNNRTIDQTSALTALNEQYGQWQDYLAELAIIKSNFKACASQFNAYWQDKEPNLTLYALNKSCMGEFILANGSLWKVYYWQDNLNPDDMRPFILYVEVGQAYQSFTYYLP